MTQKINLYVLATIFTLFNSFAVSQEEVIFKRSDAIFPEAKKNTALIKRHHGAVIFDYQRESQKNYDLLLGEIKYQESDESDESGFIATQLQTIKGDVTRTVYDYSKSFSTTQILNDLKLKLSHKGFKEVFSCESSQCGSVSGWKVFLYPYIGNTDKEQRYFVANNNDVTVVFYINEIAEQARGVLDIIDFSNNSIVSIEPVSLEKSVKVYFQSGKSTVQPDKLSGVSNLVMLALKEKKSLIVKGYTDATGSEKFNNALSLDRARYVKKVLNQIYSVPNEKIEALGMGVDDSSLSAGLESRKKSRRVEVLVKENT